MLLFSTTAAVTNILHRNLNLFMLMLISILWAIPWLSFRFVYCDRRWF